MGKQKVTRKGQEVKSRDLKVTSKSDKNKVENTNNMQPSKYLTTQLRNRLIIYNK